MHDFGQFKTAGYCSQMCQYVVNEFEIKG